MVKGWARSQVAEGVSTYLNMYDSQPQHNVFELAN